MSSDDEKRHPPVPPSNHHVAPELGEHGSRTLDRERLDTECPGCGGPVYYKEVATGEVVIASWDPAEFDPGEYDLTTSYERTERYQECQRCGWRVYV